MTDPPVADFRLGLAGRDLTVANLYAKGDHEVHLVYSGLLRASGNKPKPDDARDIRDKLHPQIEYLWQTHSALKRLNDHGARKLSDRLLGPGPESSPFSAG